MHSNRHYMFWKECSDANYFKLILNKLTSMDIDCGGLRMTLIG